MTVSENIAYPLRIQGVQSAVRKERANASLERFPLGIRPDQYPYQLSGGQQQLVSLLRSLVVQPDFILLDEPFSALDQQTRWAMAFHMEKVWMKDPVPTVFVSHDVDEAVMLADQVALMGRSGRIEAIVENPLPHPRDVSLLTSQEHVQCRNALGS